MEHRAIAHQQEPVLTTTDDTARDRTLMRLKNAIAQIIGGINLHILIRLAEDASNTPPNSVVLYKISDFIFGLLHKTQILK
jgi:hypothetical protein